MDKKRLLNVLSDITLEDSISFSDPDVLKELNLSGNNIVLVFSISNPSLQFKNKLNNQIKSRILQVFPKAEVNIKFIIEKGPTEKKTNSIRNIIVVASGKGGVGKSTVTSNLAIALKNQGYKVGVVDADIYGPSIPLMFDAEHEKPKAVKVGNQSLMGPIISYGIKIMSIGFFADSNTAFIWRGPMATKALKEIIHQTNWGDLDYLLIDLPPGTGDIHLSIVQTLSITGAIIITTPQPVALIDARKAIKMFKKGEINIPIIGLVENMSSLLLDNKTYHIFGKDGGKMLCESESIQLLGELPLDQSIREAGDIGRPAALQNSDLADIFNHLASQVKDSISKRNTQLPPTKKVEITHNKGCN